MLSTILWIVGIVAVIVVAAAILWAKFKGGQRELKDYERSLKMIPMLIHLPPESDDKVAGGRDERDLTDEILSEAQVMYSIVASTVTKGLKTRIYGQRAISFEILVKDGAVKYYVVVPAVIRETLKQAVHAAYPTARLEEIEKDNIFSETGKIQGVVGGELSLKKEGIYPIATYKDTKRDASMAILNALSQAKKGEGMALQMIVRPTDGSWIDESKNKVKDIQDGKKSHDGAMKIWAKIPDMLTDVMFAFFRPPEEREDEKGDKKPKEPLTNAQQAEIGALEEKARFSGFEVMIRLIASSDTKARSEALLSGLVASFAQFDSQNYNGFRYEVANDTKKLAADYIFYRFPYKKKSVVLNSVELASIFHLPSQNVIPNSQVERQMMKQVDGPAQLIENGVLIGINEYRGQKKQIKLSVPDRRRHVYVIGSTGMGKSVFMRNIAYQDMMDGRGFAFIDPHGDVAEELLSMVPPERIDDVIYFNPGDLENPMGMNMFEFQTPDQKDFIVQEGINMLYSLFDPGHTGIFGPRGEHMFRNAALLLMSDPKGATFIDIPQCFIDPEFVKEKLQYVTDKNVYDYWTKEFPASQKSNDAGEVTTWFVSKWGPFVSNTIIRNTLGQVKSGFNIREVMDNKKILLVNLSKGAMGEVNSKLMGMIFVMKFQAAAMSRVDTPEDDREDFCLFVDEFQNFSTESFESILSEARKFRLNLVVANQFMTQLNEKIREGVLGNVGTIVAGRLGVTDAQLMERVFAPTFTVDDLHKTPNRNAIATVMTNGVPSAPFTMTWPKLGEENAEVLKNLKMYSAAKYGRPRAEVEREIQERQNVKKAGGGGVVKAGGGVSGGSGGSGSSGGATVASVPVGIKKVPAAMARAGGAAGGAVEPLEMAPEKPVEPKPVEQAQRLVEPKPVKQTQKPEVEQTQKPATTQASRKSMIAQTAATIANVHQKIKPSEAPKQKAVEPPVEQSPKQKETKSSAKPLVKLLVEQPSKRSGLKKKKKMAGETYIKLH